MAVQPTGGNTPVNPFPPGSISAEAFDIYGPPENLPRRPKTQEYVDSLAQLIGPQGSVDPDRAAHIKFSMDKIKNGMENDAIWHLPPAKLPPEVEAFMHLNEDKPVDSTVVPPVIVPV